MESPDQARPGVGRIPGDVPTRELAAVTVLAANDGTFLEWFRRSASLGGKDLVRAFAHHRAGRVAAPQMQHQLHRVLPASPQAGAQPSMR